LVGRGRDVADGGREIFDGDGDAFVGVVEEDHDELGEDLGFEDDAVSLWGADAGFLSGESFGEFLVGLVFVAEAAHEAPAAAGDLERVERRLLDLGGLHGDGLQDLEEVLAAAVLAAFFVVGGEACLVACADELHLDASLWVDALEVFGEEVEVHALFGVVVEGEAFVAEDGLGVDDFDLDVPELGAAASVHLEFVAGLLELGLVLEVFGGGDAEDAAVVEEGVVAAAGVLDVFEHLLSADAFGASGV
jgi:hypothetical protein